MKRLKEKEKNQKNKEKLCSAYIHPAILRIAPQADVAARAYLKI